MTSSRIFPSITPKFSPNSNRAIASCSLTALSSSEWSNTARTGLFKLEANNNGIVTSRKGLALPGKSIPLPALTEKDKKDLVDGLALGVDAVALSFVQSPEDIREAKSIIRSHSDRDIPVIAKLERRNAVDRLDAILKEVDIVMVARGDLGIECPLPELPAMQKRIIRACNRAAKPSSSPRRCCFRWCPAPPRPVPKPRTSPTPFWTARIA